MKHGHNHGHDIDTETSIPKKLNIIKNVGIVSVSDTDTWSNTRTHLLQGVSVHASLVITIAKKNKSKHSKYTKSII
jgi:hypothetical protein